ncbi:hypothetical protein [Amycolatopsis sp. cmx-4-61]|uniref:hypothetical protein n=1 Tax=Amycolatopsis sp. cmx-4-61 TaxID=2790937 RepID=UPI003979ABC0
MDNVTWTVAGPVVDVPFPVHRVARCSRLEAPMPFPLVALRHAEAWGQLARSVAVLLAFLPLLVVVVCAAPALVVGNFVPSMRKPTTDLIAGSIKWTEKILSVVTAVSAPPPPVDVPRQRRPVSEAERGADG